jgi:hypothetical protein
VAKPMCVKNKCFQNYQDTYYNITKIHNTNSFLNGKKLPGQSGQGGQRRTGQGQIGNTNRLKNYYSY